MAQYNKNTEEYLESNKSLFEVSMLATANGEPVSVTNPLPATLGSDTITITGSVNVPTSVEINNDEGNPIPVNGTVSVVQPVAITDNGGSLTVDGTVNIGNLPDVSGIVEINNFPSIQTVDGSVDANVSGIVEVSNFPATQTVDGTVNVNNFPANQVVSGTVDVGNFPATQTVDGSVSVNNFPATQTVDGTVNANVNGSVDVNNFPANQVVSGTVDVGNFPATQTVDGSVSVNNTEANPVPVSGTVNAVFAEGTNKPWNLQVAQGLVAGHTFNHKFGAVPLMSINTTGSVWDVNDTVYPWDALGNGSVVNIERNDVDDNGNIVTIQGLDENWDFAEETITITGENQSGTQLFRRVNRAFVTNGTNVADIDIEAGTAGGTTVARITAGLGQTLMAVYTVPAGKTAYLQQGKLSAESGKDATGFMFVRYFGENNFRVGHTFEVFGGASDYSYNFSYPIPIPEKSDIDVRVSTRDNNGRYTAAFDVLIIDNA